MQLTPASVMQRWFDELWNGGDESTIERLLHADGVIHGLPTPDGEAIRGPAGFTPFYRAFRDAFPNLQIDIVHAVSEGDWTVAHCRVRATHDHDAFGVPATGHPIEFFGVAIGRVVGGQLVEGWNCFDFLTMYQQLGVPMQLPAPR